MCSAKINTTGARNNNTKNFVTGSLAADVIIQHPKSKVKHDAVSRSDGADEFSDEATKAHVMIIRSIPMIVSSTVYPYFSSIEISLLPLVEDDGSVGEFSLF